MRVLIDYRAALRERSGVGEYTHQLVRALLAAGRAPVPSGVDVTVFSSSSKDRLPDDPELAGAHRVDRQIPVGLLNLAWHRLGFRLFRRWKSRACGGRPAADRKLINLIRRM